MSLPPILARGIDVPNMRPFSTKLRAKVESTCAAGIGSASKQ